MSTFVRARSPRHCAEKSAQAGRNLPDPADERHQPVLAHALQNGSAESNDDFAAHNVDRPQPEDQRDAFIAEQGPKLPWGRLGTPDDIGKAATFLSSDDADYITGTTLNIKGLTAR